MSQITTKFSQFQNGNTLKTSDITVGLRSGLNTQFANTGLQDSAGSQLITYGLNGANGVAFNGTGSISLPVGTTAQRPATTLGAIRLNTTTGFFEVSTDGVTWVDLAVGGGGIGTINGTANQINSSTVAGVTTLSLSSTIVLPGTLSTANTVTLSGLTASTILGLDASKNIVSVSGLPITVGATGTVLRSNGTAWIASTATFADTYAAGNILYSNGANAVTGLATTNSASLSTNASGVPTWLALTDGQIVIGSTIGAPLAANLVAGSGVTISNGHNSITISATGSGGTVTSVTASAPLASSGGNTPDISLTGVVAETHGGTNQSTYTLGDILYASAANTLSKLAGNITSTKQYLSQTGTGAVSAAPVWATISGSDITGAALTKVDDTNVTLTLGGTPATALLRAASITAGWTGQLSLARGGTNADLSAAASLGGIVYSTATAMAILAGTATARQMLQSGASAAPAWSSTTWPATSTANNILYSSATNVIDEITSANSATIVTTSAGVPQMSGTMTNGQVIIGSTGATPTAANLTAGVGIQITNAAASITVASTGTTINTQTASYTLVLGDAGKIVEMNVGSANNLTVPTNASVAFATGTIIDILQFGAGKTTVVAAGGVTIESLGGNLSLNGQYAGASLYKRGTDDWVLVGNLTA